jgi:divalent metal cation (Fe/Co/Zn/Cd) transporter
VFSDRSNFLTSALRLSFFTIAWNGAIGAVALAVSVADGSLALASFGLSALLDVSASVVLVWRFTKEQRDPLAAERFERHAQGYIVIAMLAVGVYVAVQGFRALVGGAHPEASAFGVILAAVSLVVLPVLAWRKLDVAQRLASQALRGDGILTGAAAVLAATTLTALLLNSTLGWWWADPTAALLVAAALTTEGMRIGIRHRFG